MFLNRQNRQNIHRIQIISTLLYRYIAYTDDSISNFNKYPGFFKIEKNCNGSKSLVFKSLQGTKGIAAVVSNNLLLANREEKLDIQAIDGL